MSFEPRVSRCASERVVQRLYHQAIGKREVREKMAERERMRRMAESLT
jgi:hypothetical protein